MSYRDVLEDVFGLLGIKRPVWLFEFNKGSERIFLTTHDKDIVTVPDMFAEVDVFNMEDVFGRTWVSSPVGHPRIPSTRDASRSALTLTFPLSDPFARGFLPQSYSGETTTLIIYRAFRNDPDFQLKVKYRGELVDQRPVSTGSEKLINLTFEDEVADLGNKALVWTAQPTCHYTVYHPGCDLNIDDHFVAAVATAIANENELTVTEAVLQPDGTYLAGVLDWNGMREMIVFHEGTSIHIEHPIPGLDDEITTNGSANIQIAPGCDRLEMTCFSRFGNHLNFPGLARMTDTPYGRRIG